MVNSNDNGNASQPQSQQTKCSPTQALRLMDVIRHDKALPPAVRLVLLEIAGRLNNKTGIANISHRSLVKALGVSSSTIHRVWKPRGEMWRYFKRAGTGLKGSLRVAVADVWQAPRSSRRSASLIEAPRASLSETKLALCTSEITNERARRRSGLAADEPPAPAPIMRDVPDRAADNRDYRRILEEETKRARLNGKAGSNGHH